VLGEVTAREIGRVTIAEALEMTALVARDDLGGRISQESREDHRLEMPATAELGSKPTGRQGYVAIPGLEALPVPAHNHVTAARPAFQPLRDWLEGDEPSDLTGALGRKRRQRGASPSVRNRSARGHRYTPDKGSNPVSRGWPPNACGKLTARQAQGRR
jgi:hypothetical protein